MAKSKTDKISLEERIKALDKKYGQKSVIHGNEVEKPDIVVSTGSLGFDIATGIGGIPFSTPEKGNGKIIEFTGWESSGKSTLVQTIIGNAQKKGIKVAIIDSETSIDENYATALGVNLEDLLLIQLDEGAGEAAYDKFFYLIESGEIGLGVIDSYNALKPKKIIEDGLEASNMGLHARMMDKVMSKCAAYASQFGTTFILCGQLREKIGVMFGSPETTQGGNAPKFYCHMRMEMSRSTTNDNTIFEGDNTKGEKLGNLHKVHIKKNKMAPPFKKAEFNIIYGLGVDKYSEIIDLGKKYELLTKRGDAITYNGAKFTEAEFLQTLKEDEDFFQGVRDQILKTAQSKMVNEPQPIDEQAIVEGLASEMEVEIN